MRRNCARRTRALHAAWTAALVWVLAGCGGGVAVDETMIELGPRVGFELPIGWQDMGAGGPEGGGLVVYTEGGMEWSHKLVVFTWGLRTEKLWLEPCFLVGTGEGTIDNGMFLLLGVPLAPAKVEDMGGRAVGGGIKVRFLLEDTRVRFGLDLRLVEFDGECTFTVEDLPAFTTLYDAGTSQFEVGLVIDYDDPSYRPYLSVGFLSIINSLDRVASPGDPLIIQTSDIFGAKLGVVFKQLFGGPLDAEVAAGYYGGPAFHLGMGYRF
ncbi:MAG: hypothetical protein ACYSU0_20830 [Planctomycetota bacterium]|jgi:hypothetical protein